MNALEEIREKLIPLDKFIEENKNIEKRLPVNNINDLIDYYKNTRKYIIDELNLSSYETIPRIINDGKIETEARATLIMDSSLREQNALVSMFNKDLYDGVFKDTILQDGIFLPASRSKYMPNPPKYYFLDPVKGRPNVSTEHIRFLFDKNALTTNKTLNPSIQESLKNHIFRTKEFSATDYALIKEYFVETAPFVLNCLLIDFKDAYIEAKRENLPVILSTAMVNTGDDIRSVIVLEALYNELLKLDVFKGTIFEAATTSVTKGNTKYFNPILMEPIKESAPKKQYNLRLVLNTHAIESNSEKRLCYNKHEG